MPKKKQRKSNKAKRPPTEYDPPSTKAADDSPIRHEMRHKAPIFSTSAVYGQTPPTKDDLRRPPPTDGSDRWPARMPTLEISGKDLRKKSQPGWKPGKSQRRGLR